MNGELTKNLRNRREICEKMAAIAGRNDGNVKQDYEQLKAEFAASGEVPPEYAEILDREFAAAEQAAAEKVRSMAELAERRDEFLTALENILMELSRLALAPLLLVYAHDFEKLCREWQKVSGNISGVEAMAEAFAAREAELKERLAAEKAALAADLERMQSLTGALKNMLDMPENEVRDLRKANNKECRTICGRYPDDFAAVSGAKSEYDAVDRQLGERLNRFFQTLDNARWESYTLKLDMLQTIAKLAECEEKELPHNAKILRVIREKWKSLGAVPHEKNEEINPKYLELTGKLQKRIDAFFKEQHRKHAEAAAAKTALCEEAEAMQSSTDWRNTAEALKSLQAKWKEIPSAGRKADDELYKRFRSSCNTFFDARNAVFESKRRSYDEAAEVKVRLCEAAEALASREGGDAVRHARELRNEYASAGSAGRREKELFQRFNAAMDIFFGARNREMEENLARRNALADVLDSISSANGYAGAEKLYRETAAQLKEAGPVPKSSLREQEKREHAALRRAEKVLQDMRAEYRRGRFEAFRRDVLQCGSMLDCLLSGDSSGATGAAASLPLAEMTEFPVLSANVQLMEASSGAAELEKLSAVLDKNRSEYEKLVGELEKSCGGGAADLASELRNAMMGSFGGAVRPERFDREDWERRFFSRGGVLPVSELEKIFASCDELLAGQESFRS